MCSTVFILVPANPGAQQLHDLGPCQRPTFYRESVVAVVLLYTLLVTVVALLTAACAGKLARMDGATFPTALARAATTFATVVTLAATVTAALTALPT
ncbi:hypothetical protein STBA_64010 [Streptomyces sp. MP131-18]|nr:hypothetical protein STBA_64010 [Streptomyces sp. MP131-18]